MGTSSVPQVQHTSSLRTSPVPAEAAPDMEKMQLTSSPKTSAATANSAPACDCGCARLKFSQLLKTSLASRLNTQAGEFWAKHHSDKEQSSTLKLNAHWTENRY